MIGFSVSMRGTAGTLVAHTQRLAIAPHLLEQAWEPRRALDALADELVEEVLVVFVAQRDLASLADIADRAAIGRLLQAIGATSGAELNIDGLSRSLGTSATTIRRHVDLLETLFLIRRLPAWSSNLLNRSIKREKVHVADSGLLAYLVGADEGRVEQDLDLGGMFFETFVAMELHRQISWRDERPRLFHYRDRDKREIDLVIEHRDGSISAVEVKAAASVNERDLRGLKHMRDKLGAAFKAGVLLYTGANTVGFDDRLAAVPIAGLWTP